MSTQQQPEAAPLQCFECGAEVKRLPGTPEDMEESMCPACIKKFPLAMCHGCPAERQTKEVVGAHFVCDNMDCPNGLKELDKTCHDRKNWLFHDGTLR